MVYQRDNGKSPHGKLFGIFLILIFGVRFFIEFIKYHQSTLIGDASVLNMGQILSIPLVVAGMYFWWSSSKKSVEP
jgi:prolipoprotein diacylglyceryltransferase